MDHRELLQHPLQFYLSLFPSHTRSLLRFSALAEAVLRQAAELLLLVPETGTAFSFASAVGIQLDALGESVGIPRQEGWDDETYRKVLLKKLKLRTWDGTDETAPSFLSEGETMCENGDGTVTVHSEEALPLPAGELFPVPVGVRTEGGNA